MHKADLCSWEVIFLYPLAGMAGIASAPSRSHALRVKHGYTIIDSVGFSAGSRNGLNEILVT